MSSTIHRSSRDRPISPFLMAWPTLHLLCCQIYSHFFPRILLNRDLHSSLVCLLVSISPIAPCSTALLAATFQLVHHLLQALQLLHRLLQQPELLGQLDGEGRQGELVRTFLSLLCPGPGAPAVARGSKFNWARGRVTGFRSQVVGSSSVPSLMRVKREVRCLAGLWYQCGCEQETGTNAEHCCPHVFKICKKQISVWVKRVSGCLGYELTA